MQHVAAVHRRLVLADEAAQAGDRDEALGWPDVVDAAESHLSPDHVYNRALWEQARCAP